MRGRQVRLGAQEEMIVNTKANIALSYSSLDRDEEALILRREVYAKSKALEQEEKLIFTNALNFAVSLRKTKRFTEMKSFLRKQLPRARRALGAEDGIYFDLRRNYAACLCFADGASRDDVVESIAILEELAPTTRRVLGLVHPFTEDIQYLLEEAQRKLASFE